LRGAVAPSAPVWGFTASPHFSCGAWAAGPTARAAPAERDGAIRPEGIVVGASHTHASADTTSDIPAWYYEQVRDAIREALAAAVEGLTGPVALETGACVRAACPAVYCDALHRRVNDSASLFPSLRFASLISLR
jgi:hypothetical protein